MTARRTVMRTVAFALLALGLVLSVEGVRTGAGADESGAELTAKAWWWRAHTSTLPATLPAPPTVQPGQLYVAGAPDGATALSALRFSVDSGHLAQALTMKVAANGDQGGSGALLLACQSGSAWTPVEDGAWEDHPNVTPTACVNGKRSDDGTTWTFPVAALQTAQVLDLVLTPGTDTTKPTGGGSTFSLVFEAPAGGALAVSEGQAAAPPLALPVASPSAISTGGASGAGAGSTSTFSRPSTPIAPVTPALPADKTTQTATAPARQAASQPALDAAVDAAHLADRVKWPGFVVLGLAAVMGVLAFQEDRRVMLMAATSGTSAPGGLGRFVRDRTGTPTSLT